jgi:hypothetical protein
MFTSICDSGTSRARLRQAARRMRVHPADTVTPGPFLSDRLPGRGNRALARGIKTHLALTSLLHAWAARNLNAFVECLMALQQPAVAAPPQTPLPER